MANISRPNGFRPVRHLNGSMYNGQMNLYFIPPTDANAYAVGDLVTVTGTANTSDFYAYGVPVISRCSATQANQIVSPGNNFLGAIVGFKVDPTNLQNSGYNPASNANGRYAWVSDSPDVIYEAQFCGASGVAVAPRLSQTTSGVGNCDIDLNYQIYAPAASSNFGAGLSNMMVDQSTASTLTTYPVTIVRFSGRIDQDLTTSGLYSKVEVILQNHAFAQAVVAGV